MPPTIIVTVGMLPLPPLLALLELQAVMPARDTAAAAAASARAGFLRNMGVLLRNLRDEVKAGCGKRCGGWDQIAAISVGAGGRHESSRCSSRLISHSAVRARMAMISIAANTPSGSKLFWAVAMTRPSPFWAPRNSPTMAPMIEKPKATCRLAMIQVSADGKT